MTNQTYCHEARFIAIGTVKAAGQEEKMKYVRFSAKAKESLADEFPAMEKWVKAELLKEEPEGAIIDGLYISLWDLVPEELQEKVGSGWFDD